WLVPILTVCAMESMRFAPIRRSPDEMTKASPKSYSFNDFTLDLGRACLLRMGEEVKLRPKVFEVLKFLVENNNRLVTKEELIKAVWPDTFVTDDSLVQCLVEIRRALGDGAPSCIKTVPRRGYVFEAQVNTSLPVQDVQEPVSVTEKPVINEVPEMKRPKAAKRSVSVGVMAICATALAIFLYFTLATVPSVPALTEKDTVLIADFVNTTGDDIFDGTLKQALAVQLGQAPFLNIFSDDRIRETLSYMNRSPDERITRQLAREISQRQGIKALLAGSIATLGSHYV